MKKPNQDHQAQAQAQSTVYQRSMQNRLFRLSMLSLILWLLVWVNPSFFDQAEPLENQESVWPAFDTWQSFSLSRPGDLKVTIFKRSGLNPKTHSISHQKALQDKNEQRQWLIQSDDQAIRVIDPLLHQRLIEELTQTKIVEKRKLGSEKEAKRLALSEIALTVNIQDIFGQSFRFRLGSEHLRHSTWVRTFNQKGQAEPIALRLSGRLRRALDHLSYRWPDRRLGLKTDEQLVKVECFQGAYQPSKQLRQRGWTLQKRLPSTSLATLPSTGFATQQHLEQLETDPVKADAWYLNMSPRPTLDKPTLKGFLYTLKTLRVSRFMQAKDLVKPWRPTHTCIWESEQGQSSWLSFGQAQFKRQLKHKTQSVPNSAQDHFNETFVNLAEGEAGLGVIPKHLAHFLVQQVSDLYSRHLSFVEPSEIVKISFVPKPSPLLDLSTPWQTAWTLSKTQTAWRLEKQGESQFLSEAQQSQFFAQLSKESIQVTHQSAHSQKTFNLSQDLSMHDRLTIHLAPQICQNNQVRECRFELILLQSDPQTKFYHWYRPYDGLVFTISKKQNERLIKLKL